MNKIVKETSCLRQFNSNVTIRGAYAVHAKVARCVCTEERGACTEERVRLSASTSGCVLGPFSVGKAPHKSCIHAMRKTMRRDRRHWDHISLISITPPEWTPLSTCPRRATSRSTWRAHLCELLRPSASGFVHADTHNWPVPTLSRCAHARCVTARTHVVLKEQRTSRGPLLTPASFGSGRGRLCSTPRTHPT